MANDQSVQLNVGAGGKLVRTVEVTTPSGVVEQQVVSIADASGVLGADEPSMADILLELRKISGALQLLLYDYNIKTDPLEIV